MEIFSPDTNDFEPFISSLRDSMLRAAMDSIHMAGTAINIDLDIDDSGNIVNKSISEQKVKIDIPKIRFLSRSIPENWDKLVNLVEADTSFFADDKAVFYERLSEPDPDKREGLMKKDPYYKRMKDNIYPQLRVVRFDFMLHLKSTVNSRIITDEVDEVYAAGLKAIKNRDWETGIEILRESYPNDYNLGVAYLMMDRNVSAKAIFEALPKTVDVNYMLALAYMRLGMENEAKDAFVNCYRKDKSKYWRGNRDPEIKFLINKYNLPFNLDEEENDIL